MFEYELHQIRSAELIREAENYRLGREALRARRAARDSRKAAEEHDTVTRFHIHRPRRPRFARAT